MADNLSVKELRNKDIEHIVSYWCNATPDFLERIGVDVKKIPPAEKLEETLTHEIKQPLNRKLSYTLIWFINNEPVGHANLTKIEYGKEANMHLHLWHPKEREKGLGTKFIRLSLPYFFENLKLERLYCEPYALNPAPNKILEKVGFQVEKEYVGIPGFVNFEQLVWRWKLTKERYRKIILQF